MINCMGGFSSSGYNDFKNKWVDAFLYLRKKWKIFINIFYLMIDSGIKDIS